MRFFLLRRVILGDRRFKEVFVGSAVTVIEYEHLRYAMLLNRKGKLIEKGGLPRRPMDDSQAGPGQNQLIVFSPQAQGVHCLYGPMRVARIHALKQEKRDAGSVIYF